VTALKAIPQQDLQKCF